MTQIDFTLPSSVVPWQAIDDRVMGGASRSGLRHDPAGFAVFEGTVSPDNGGGFASVRHRGLALGSVTTRAYRLEVRGDGRRYKLTMRTDGVWDAVQYQAAFQPPAGQWTTVDIPVMAFAASLRGRPVPHAPVLSPEKVSQVGWLISDRQMGPFALCVRALCCVEGEAP